jgi:hypothetical protein
VVIGATAILGSAAMIETVVFLFRPGAAFVDNPVKAVLDVWPWLWIVFLGFAIVGIVAQVMNTRNFAVQEYSRYG